MAKATFPSREEFFAFQAEKLRGEVHQAFKQLPAEKALRAGLLYQQYMAAPPGADCDALLAALNQAIDECVMWLTFHSSLGNWSDRGSLHNAVARAVVAYFDSPELADRAAKALPIGIQQFWDGPLALPDGRELPLYWKVGALTTDRQGRADKHVLEAERWAHKELLRHPIHGGGRLPIENDPDSPYRATMRKYHELKRKYPSMTRGQAVTHLHCSEATLKKYISRERRELGIARNVDQA